MTATDLRAAPRRVAAPRKTASVRVLWMIVLLSAIVALCAASVAFGVREVSPHDILAALGGDTSTVARAAVVARVPRTVLALLVGAALAMSGTTMQAVTRNPLGDPGILGVTSGAALAVVIGIAFFGMSSPYAYLVVAIAGAAVAAVFVYAVGSLGRGG
ncbi:MAG: iron chelate uptake ABC transporter family permease subunit, partial [Humibacter sp.]